VIKTLLCLRHQQLPPLASFQRINPKIDFARSPFYLVDKLQAWVAPRDAEGRELPRRAGVSSFGFGGANAHVVIEEYVAPIRARPPQGDSEPALIVLSAADAARLKESARRLDEFLGANPDAYLPAVAHTLRVGRQSMPQRLAIVAADLAAVRAGLAACCGGRPAPRVFSGRAPAPSVVSASGQKAPESASAVHNLDAIAAGWVTGEEFPELSESELRSRGSPRATDLSVCRRKFQCGGAERNRNARF